MIYCIKGCGDKEYRGESKVVISDSRNFAVAGREVRVSEGLVRIEPYVVERGDPQMDECVIPQKEIPPAQVRILCEQQFPEAATEALVLWLDDQVIVTTGRCHLYGTSGEIMETLTP